MDQWCLADHLQNARKVRAPVQSSAEPQRPQYVLWSDSPRSPPVASYLSERSIFSRRASPVYQSHTETRWWIYAWNRSSLAYMMASHLFDIRDTCPNIKDSCPDIIKDRLDHDYSFTLRSNLTPDITRPESNSCLDLVLTNHQSIVTKVHTTSGMIERRPCCDIRPANMT